MIRTLLRWPVYTAIVLIVALYAAIGLQAASFDHANASVASSARTYQYGIGRAPATAANAIIAAKADAARASAIHNLDRALINRPFGADHLTEFDWATWWLQRSGSWWVALSYHCLTGNWQDSAWVRIDNAGSQAHWFRTHWQNYAGTRVLNGDQSDFIAAGGHTYFFLNVDPRLQSEHWRWRLEWLNSSDQWVLLNDHTFWTNDPSNPYAGMTFGHTVNQCASYS